MQAGRGVLLVTGASRGIGAATAILAARSGWDVCVNYRRRADAAEAVLKRAQEAGARAVAVQADVSFEEEVARLFDVAEQELGALTGLVNNAGVSGGRRAFAELPLDVLREVLAVNVVGSFLCAREAVRRMSTARGGRGGAIVNLSSLAACSGGRQLTHYAASKAAIEAFTVGLAREVASEGIRVNTVRPGVIATEGLEAPADPTPAAQDLPLGRPGSPDEVARAILWLLSPEASYTTGSVLSVSGGRV
jgi:NAD(P)-dependent dehydrogenase (short-subunit alcohol dehydrogenase family)